MLWIGMSRLQVLQWNNPPFFVILCKQSPRSFLSKFLLAHNELFLIPYHLDQDSFLTQCSKVTALFNHLEFALKKGVQLLFCVVFRPWSSPCYCWLKTIFLPVWCRSSLFWGIFQWSNRTICFFHWSWCTNLCKIISFWS